MRAPETVAVSTMGPLRGGERERREPERPQADNPKPSQTLLTCAIPELTRIRSRSGSYSNNSTSTRLLGCARLRAHRSARRPAASVLVPAALLLVVLVAGPSRAYFWSGEPAPDSLASSLLSAIKEGGQQPEKPILSTIQEAVSAAVAPSSAPAAPPPSGSSSAPAAPGAQTSSIVASLSSAVASAAAAAAVAAAQSTLSGGDARSLLTGGAGQSPAQSGPAAAAAPVGAQQRPARSQAAVQLAMRLAADAMPEVPYSILHNMKKLDHAAPFYNVGARTNNPGLQFVKEGLAQTLGPAAAAAAATATGSGAAGGVGRFEQLSSLLRSPIWKRLADGYGEFASEFRSLFRPPPKASGAASAPAGSSAGRLLRDISLPAILVLLASTIPSEQWRPVRTRRKSLPLALELSPAVEPLAGAETSLSAVPMFSLAAPAYQQQQQHQLYQQQLEQAINQQQQPLHRSGDINLRRPAAANWPPINGAELEEQSIRRVGEPAAKPVATELEPAAKPQLGSLTSSGGGGRLMNRIMNANGDNHRHLSYSLLAPDAGGPGSQAEKRQHLLSAMNQALGQGSGSLALNNNAPIYQLRTLEMPLSALRRREQPPAGQEQRELGQLIPQSWREALKRTVSSVQQQASTQWRSIEGQLTNWVQDKLKTLPGGGQPAPSSSQAAAAPPVANIIASVSSTAMNMLGLGASSTGGASKPVGGQQAPAATELQPVQEQPSTSSSRNKEPAKPATSNKQPTAGPKAALAGVANLIVNTLTNRSTTAPPAKAATNESEAPRAASQYPTLTSSSSTTQADRQTSATSAGSSSTSAPPPS